MSKPTLFICTSCHHLPKNRLDDQPADGAWLLEQLDGLLTKPFRNLEIQSVVCLWTCDKPCAVAFSAPHKPTYLFTTLPIDETAPALLQFGHLYLTSTTGDIPWKQFPAVFQSASIAKIPALGEGVET